MTIFVLQLAPLHLRNGSNSRYQVDAAEIVRHFLAYFIKCKSKDPLASPKLNSLCVAHSIVEPNVHAKFHPGLLSGFVVCD